MMQRYRVAMQGRAEATGDELYAVYIPEGSIVRHVVFIPFFGKPSGRSGRLTIATGLI